MFGKKMEHRFTIEHTMWSDDLRNALYDTGYPVTSHRYTEEEADGKKVILYKITVIGDNETWDELNRKMGKLGITTYKGKKRATTKVK